MNNNQLKTVAVVSVSLMFVALGALAFQDNTQTTSTPSTTTRQEEREVVRQAIEKVDTSDETLAAELKEGFLEGCTEDGTTSLADCTCLYNGLDSRLTTNQLFELGNRMWSGTTTEADMDIMIDAVYDCL